MGAEQKEPERHEPSEQPGQKDRGRAADAPRQIPARGWRDIVLRLKKELAQDNLSMIAAAVAFYIWLALMPSLAALVSIYGLVADPVDIERQISSLGNVIPGQAQQLISQQLKWISSQQHAAGVAAVIGIVLALWSSSSAMKALINALNIAYEEHERRGFFKLNAVALALTLGAIVIGVISIGLVVVLPAVLTTIGFGRDVQLITKIVRWPLLALIAMTALAVLYRYAPSREKPKWRWVSWGAVLAMLMWVAASAAFSFYVSHFGNYNKTYGSLGAIIILLLWLEISAYLVLLGAELNAEMELQTARDTTTGQPEPMGERGAFPADHVGQVP